PACPLLTDLPGCCEAASAEVTRLEAILSARAGAAAPADADAIAAARTWSEELANSLSRAGMTALYLLERLQSIRARAEAIVRETDFSFLYDEARCLFHIGYNVTVARLDDNHYDLLVSEARLASFIAIAKGDVPQEHWLHLGRPIGHVDGTRA